MSTRALPSLAHALGVAPDLDATLVALGEALLDGDRSALLALFRFDGRKQLLKDRLTPIGDKVSARLSIRPSITCRRPYAR